MVKPSKKNSFRYKKINGILVGRTAKDLTNLNFGRLRVTKLLGKHPTRTGLLWEVLCSCGRIKGVCSGDLLDGSTKSCGCLEKEVREKRMAEFSNKYSVHGWSGTKEHQSWKRIVQRCTNPNHPDYEVYSKIGICEEFKNNFLAFLEEIGEMPKNGTRWSVDRIDNTKGYIKGNIRWATDKQQARNKGMYSNNKSGVTGVHLQEVSGRSYWVATWRDSVTGKSRSKYYSIKTLGDEFAFFAACETRDIMLRRLNLLGAGYSEKHGIKEKA